MKKLLSVLLVSALVLSLGGISQAVSIKAGPLVFKTYNWEVSTLYTGGTTGVTYFRDASTPGYDAANPLHGLFSALTATQTVPGVLYSDEDQFGLLEVTQLWDGTVISGGTDIASGNKYWDKGDNGEYLRGMFWGGQDQRVFFGDDGEGGQYTRIYATGINYNFYEMNYDYTSDPQTNSLLEPWDRDGQDYFTNWRGNGEGTLEVQGTSSWFRYIGDSVGNANGQTLVFLDADANIGEWMNNPTNYLDDFWTIPSSLDGLFNGGASTEIRQSWTIFAQQPWIKSEDTGYAYYQVVPEPVTMLGMILGMGGLTRYIRKRRGL